MVPVAYSTPPPYEYKNTVKKRTRSSSSLFLDGCCYFLEASTWLLSFPEGTSTDTANIV